MANAQGEGRSTPIAMIVAAAVTISSLAISPFPVEAAGEEIDSEPAGSQPLGDAAADEKVSERRDVETIVEYRGDQGPQEPNPSQELSDTSLRSRILSGRHLAAQTGLGPGVSERRIAGQISTTYERSTPQAVREVIDGAVAQWDSVLDLAPGAPVEVSVLWTDLGTRLLGQAGTEGEYRDAKQFPTDRWYPAALANQLANQDLNGAATPEILIELNSGLGDDWFIGVEGQPSFGQIDLYSVVLHEIAHGLGFIGSATADRSGVVSVDYGPPSIYDDFLISAAGEKLTLLPTADAISNLTSDGLSIDVGFGRLMPVSSPQRFINGSSYSHFDEDVPPDQPGALMTPSLKNAEVQRDLDAAVIGVLDQVGWNLSAPLLKPTLNKVLVASGRIDLKWAEDWGQPATFPNSYLVEAKPTVAVGALPAAYQRATGPADRAASLRHLQNGTGYAVSLRPTRTGRSVGPGAESTVVLPDNPNPVSSLIVRSGTDATLAWEPPIASGLPVESYQAEVRGGAEREWSPLRVAGDRTAKYALPAGPYWFRVRAVNSAGPGPWKQSSLRGISDGPTRYRPLDGQMARLYEAYLDRTSDPAGMAYWLDVRAGGASLRDVSRAFAVSEEFTATYGALGDEQFIDRVYQNVLGRSPDSGGYRYWLDLLDQGVDRGRIMLEFSESPEFVATTRTAPPQSGPDGRVDRIYLAALRRLPTAVERQDGRALISTGSATKLAQTLIAGDEFSETHGELDDDEFIEVAVANTEDVIVGESAAGIWQAMLDGGQSRASLMVRMADSAEFVVRSGAGV